MVTITIGSPQDLNGNPWSGQSDVDAYIPVSADTSTLSIDVTLAFKNLITGAANIIIFGFSGGRDLSSGVLLKVNFNSQLPTLLPSVCGSGDQFQYFANVDFIAHPTVTSPIIDYTVVTSPCICTEIMDIFTTIDSYTCVGVDGNIGLQGKLFEITCGGGIPSPFVNQPGAVLIGLVDSATGMFYQYVAASTDSMGGFSVGFGIGSRSDVVALVPPTGTKQFSLVAYYPGNSTHKPSSMFMKSITLIGQSAGSGVAPCSLGTLLIDMVYGTAPKGAEVHNIQVAFAGGLMGVSDVHSLAEQVLSKTHDAIVSAGNASTPVTPLEIKVYQGPGVQVPIFYGFIGIPTYSFNVVATAMGSPVAGLIILAIIVAAIVILAITVYLIMSTVKDIISSGGGPVLEIGGVAVIAVTVVVGGLAAYFVLRNPATRTAIRRSAVGTAASAASYVRKRL
jgi:hypothetical protein